MARTERFFTPSQNYDIQLKIKDLDYTENLTAVRIFSSLSTAYQSVIIDMLIDPNDIILEDSITTYPFKLSIRLLNQDGGPPAEQVDFELMHVKNDFVFNEKSALSTSKEQHNAPISIVTVCRKPYNTMNTIINGVFLGSTIEDILGRISKSLKTDIIYDADGKNKEVIDQVCIPPTTTYKIIKESNIESADQFDGFLDQRFGLHEGVSGVFCQFDNKIYIKNLSAKMTKDQTFTVYQLVSDADNNEIIEKSFDGKNFYTFDTISSDYSGNAKFAVLGKNINIVVKPKDVLYYIINQDLEIVGSKYGIIDKNSKIYIDSNVDRTKFYYDTGYEKSTKPFDSGFGRAVADLATISINLERNLPILNLMNVGEAVKFVTNTIEYIDISGKYILWSSDLQFVNKTSSWETTARINLCRTNKKI